MDELKKLIYNGLMNNKPTPRALKSIRAFSYLKISELEDLVEMVEVEQYGEGQRILQEFGKEFPYMYFILKGSVNVIVEKLDHTQAYITLLGDGESFGETGLFPQLERTASIDAAQDCQVVKLHRQKLLEFITHRPAAGIKVLMMLIYGLLAKLRGLNQELAFERQTSGDQIDVDALVQDFFKGL